VSRARRPIAAPARPPASPSLRRAAPAAALAAIALLLLGVPGAAPVRADEPAHPDAHGAPMPVGGQYFRLDPFTIPVMSHTEVVRHLTFIVTLELRNESMRSRVLQRLPVLRHALNTALLHLVGVERSDGTLPPIAAVKSRMLDVTREVIGPETVRAILMESVYERRLR
jgi:hypothetical protein